MDHRREFGNTESITSNSVYCDQKIKRYMLIGSFSGYNAGDTVVLLSLLSDISEYSPNSIVFVPGLNSRCPIDQSLFNCKIVSIPINRKNFALRYLSFGVLKAMTKVNAVFLTAGTIFCRRYYDYKYSFLGTFIPVYRIAKLHNPLLKLVCYDVGISFDGSQKINNHVKNFLKSADYISLRHSQDAHGLNLKNGNLLISCDNVFGYKHPTLSMGSIHQVIIGINFASYIVRKCNVDYVSFCRKIIKTIVERFTGFTFQYILSTKGDFAFVKQLIAENLLPCYPIVNLSDLSFPEIEAVWSNLHLFVGMRMHPLIFALKHSIPTIGIVYDDKVKKLFEDLSMCQFVIDINQEASSNLLSVIDYIEDYYMTIQNQILEKCEINYSVVRNNNELIWKGII